MSESLKFNRRTFFKTSLIGGSAMTIGANTFLSGCATTGPHTFIFEPNAAPKKLLALTPSSCRVFYEAAKVVLPPNPIHSYEQVVLWVDQAISYAQQSIQDDLNLVCSLLDSRAFGLFTRGSLSSFVNMDDEDKIDALNSWRDASVLPILTAGYHGVRRLLLGAYFGPPESDKLMNYPGPFFHVKDPGPIADNGPISEPFSLTPETPTPTPTNEEGS